MPRYLTRARDEEGMALIGVLLMLVLMGALCATLAVSGQTETMAASNQENAAQARAAAEAGLNHAVAVVIAELTANAPGGNASAAMNLLLRGPDNATGTTAADADNGSLEALCVAPDPCIPRPGLGTLGLNGLQGVSYEARVLDEDDPARGVTYNNADILRINEDTQPLNDLNEKIIVRAIGYGRNNTTATLEAIIAKTSLPAIVTNGDLTISGSPKILGNNGGVHANGDLDVGASVTIAKDATASDDLTVAAGATIGGNQLEGVPQKTVPSVRAIDYKPQADYILTNSGTMTYPDGSPATCCGGWTFSNAGGGTWTLNGTGTGATYYVEGTAKVTGSPGLPGTPMPLSIIATGSIEISGSGDVIPEADNPDILFVTDKDLTITGTFGNSITAEGIILVHEQISISGTPDIAGQILVENAPSTGNPATNTISGNATITYNGVAGFGIFAVGGWREIR